MMTTRTCHIVWRLLQMMKKPSSYMATPKAKAKAIKDTPKITKGTPKAIMDTPKAIMDIDDTNQQLGKKYKCNDRHREHSKIYHSELSKLKRQGVTAGVAKKKAAAAAKAHVKALFG